MLRYDVKGKLIEVEVEGGYLYHPVFQVMRDNPGNRADIKRWHETMGERAKLYRAQTKAFDVYKALRDSRPADDPERMAAWEAYSDAKLAFQKATDKKAKQ